jgi:hypothetical protein
MWRNLSRSKTLKERSLILTMPFWRSSDITFETWKFARGDNQGAVRAARSIQADPTMI